MNTQMGLLGRKLGMTQIFLDEGEVVPVTVLEAGPNVVVQVKTEDGADGYNAVQLGFGATKPQRVNKPERGHFDKAGLDTLPQHVAEVRLTKAAAATYEPGQSLKVSDVFSTGGHADVTGTSKGRGFAGVMKRHHFRGFMRTHGTHEFFRHGGSIGTRLTPGHVLKGKRMPGHQGSEQVTVQNLEVVRVEDERNLVFLRGGVPGPTGAVVLIRQAVKK